MGRREPRKIEGVQTGAQFLEALNERLKDAPTFDYAKDEYEQGLKSGREYLSLHPSARFDAFHGYLVRRFGAFDGETARKIYKEIKDGRDEHAPCVNGSRAE